MFAFTPELQKTAEVVAGLFEIVLGAAARQGEEGLLVVISSWGFLVLFYLAVLQQTRGQLNAAFDFLRDLMGARAEELRECLLLPGYHHVHSLLQSVEACFDKPDAKYLFGPLARQILVTGDAFESFMQVALQGIVRSALAQAQTDAIVPSGFSRGVAGAASSPSSNWPPEPSTPHEILDPRAPNSYMVTLRCQSCSRHWDSGWGKGGQPYIDARHAGWKKAGGNWSKATCPGCRLTRR